MIHFSWWMLWASAPLWWPVLSLAQYLLSGSDESQSKAAALSAEEDELSRAGW